MKQYIRLLIHFKLTCQTFIVCLRETHFHTHTDFRYVTQSNCKFFQSGAVTPQIRRLRTWSQRGKLKEVALLWNQLSLFPSSYRSLYLLVVWQVAISQVLQSSTECAPILLFSVRWNNMGKVLCDDGSSPMIRGRLTKKLCSAMISFRISAKGNIRTLL